MVETSLCRLFSKLEIYFGALVKSKVERNCKKSFISYRSLESHLGYVMDTYIMVHILKS